MCAIWFTMLLLAIYHNHFYLFFSRNVKWFFTLIFFSFLNFTLFYFIILYWFCYTSTWICHGYTRVPNPEPPSHLPPYTISLGHPSAPALYVVRVVFLLDSVDLDYLEHFTKWYGLSLSNPCCRTYHAMLMYGKTNTVL